MAPTNANIFMYYIENTLLSSFNLKTTAYFRYIDDIFLIWPNGIDTLQTFLENANRTLPNIRFTHVYSSAAVSFLELKSTMELYPPVYTRKSLITIAISITHAVIQCT